MAEETKLICKGPDCGKEFLVSEILKHFQVGNQKGVRNLCRAAFSADELTSLSVAAKKRSHQREKIMKLQTKTDDETMFIFASACKKCGNVYLDFDLLNHIDRNSNCKSAYSKAEIELLVEKFSKLKTKKIRVAYHTICYGCSTPIDVSRIRLHLKDALDCNSKYSETDLVFFDKHVEVLKTYEQKYRTALNINLQLDCYKKLYEPRRLCIGFNEDDPMCKSRGNFASGIDKNCSLPCWHKFQIKKND